MTRQICIMLAVDRQNEQELCTMLGMLLREKGIGVCIHLFRGRSVLEVLGLECSGPFLLVCDEGHMRAVESSDDLDGIHVIGLAIPPVNQVRKNLSHAYCSQDALGTCLDLAVGDIFQIKEELAV